MAIVVFDQVKFLQRYPEFAPTVAAYPTSAQDCFDEACLYLLNTDASIVPAPSPRTQLLNMLTAHILFLNFGANGQAAPQTVGRISNAGEGSVSVGLDMGPTTDQEAWYNQTKYGAAYWRASAAYRSAYYFPPTPRPSCFGGL